MIYCQHLLIFTSLALLLSSCALKNTFATFGYTTPPHLLQPTQETTPVSLEIRDERKSEDVGYVQNGLGMKTARILPKQKVSTILYHSLENALREKGFIVTPSSMKVLVIINKCFTDYDAQLFGDRVVAKLDLTLHIVDPNEQLLYFKKITTEGIESPIFLYNGKNTSKALDRALLNAIRQLFDDPHFFYTLKTKATTR